MDHPTGCPPPLSTSPIRPSSEFYSFDLLTSKWQSHPGQYHQSIPGFNSVFPDWVSGHCLSAHPNQYFNLMLQSQAVCRALSQSPWTQCCSQKAAGSSAVALSCPLLGSPPTPPLDWKLQGPLAVLLRAGCCTATSPGGRGKASALENTTSGPQSLPAPHLSMHRH